MKNLKSRLIDAVKVKAVRRDASVYAILDGKEFPCTTKTQFLWYRRMTTRFIDRDGQQLDFQELNNNLYREIGYYV